MNGRQIWVQEAPKAQKTTLPGKEMRGVEEEESQILINSSHQEMESIASAH